MREIWQLRKTHIFLDPSIGLAVLGINPQYFNNDLDLFGHAFENMVIRDLLAYAENHNARILHYTDDMGPEAEKSLLKFREVIRKYNQQALENSDHPRAVYREPFALIVICANAPMAYTTDQGVKIVPIGCLRD